MFSLCHSSSPCFFVPHQTTRIKYVPLIVLLFFMLPVCTDASLIAIICLFVVVDQVKEQGAVLAADTDDESD